MFRPAEDADVPEWEIDYDELDEPFDSDTAQDLILEIGDPPADSRNEVILSSAGSDMMGIRPLHSQTEHFAGETVMGRLTTITGVAPPQRALLALRKGLFRDIVPQVTRDESREKPENVARIEQYRASILPLLETKDAITEVLDVVLKEMKRKAHRDEVLMHQLGIG
jgi:hypothetical protein